MAEAVRVDAFAGPRSNLYDRFLSRPLLRVIEMLAGILLAADLAVVSASVVSRYVLTEPFVWGDDIARALLLAVSFLGAAAALARGENAGVSFFADQLSPSRRRMIDGIVGVVIVVVTVGFSVDAFQLYADTTGQTVGAGIPQEVFFLPMCAGAVSMVVFSIGHLLHLRIADILTGAAAVGVLVAIWFGWQAVSPDTLPGGGWLMLIAFVAALCAGVPIAFVLCLSALVFIWTQDFLPGELFAQQMARGIDNFVLLAVPFFILVGYLMEANGMSVRLISLLLRGVGRMRGGLNVTMVLSMVIFSGISGSKMADVAAVGGVMVPAARKARQKAGDAVALLAASAVMAETIPPCINLIILGFVANLSIGGLFVAGLIPAAVMAAALMIAAVALGSRASADSLDLEERSMGALIGSGVVAFGLIAIIFGGYRSGFATATEISAFAVIYALIVGGLAFRELTWRGTAEVVMHSAVRSGMVLFIVAAAQSLAYTLTIQQIPHALAEMMISVSAYGGSFLFLLLSIVILILMGSVLEGAAALIIFGPLLMPVARQLGIDPLHYGIVLVVGMGIGLFAPPLGLGLYGSCLIGGVTLEETVRPILKYLAVLFVCLLLIAFVPAITTALPRAAGY